MFVRKVRTASGAVAVQVMRKAGRRDVVVEHVGSAHTDAELGVLLERARRIATGDVEDVVASEVRGDLAKPGQRDLVVASEPPRRAPLVHGRERKLVLSRLLGDDQALEVRPRVVQAQMGGEPLENGAAVGGPREPPADPSARAGPGGGGGQRVAETFVEVHDGGHSAHTLRLPPTASMLLTPRGRVLK